MVTLGNFGCIARTWTTENFYHDQAGSNQNSMKWPCITVIQSNYIENNKTGIKGGWSRRKESKLDQKVAIEDLWIHWKLRPPLHYTSSKVWSVISFHKAQFFLIVDYCHCKGSIYFAKSWRLSSKQQKNLQQSDWVTLTFSI